MLVVEESVLLLEWKIEIDMEKGYTLHVHQVGYVRYVDHLGSDRRIVEAARISYGSPSKGDDADRKLLEYLFKNRHTSPFEQCNITFNIKMPIFCMRQFVRHRTFRLNEWSGRYSEMRDEFFIPIEWRLQDTKNRQGSFNFPNWKDDTNAKYWQQEQNLRAREVFNHCMDTYKAMLADGVAKELARIVLPLAMFTEIYVNCDLHNLMHFLYLRTHPHAQQEIRDIAWPMYQIMKDLFPWCAELWMEYKPIMEKKISIHEENVPDKS